MGRHEAVSVGVDSASFRLATARLILRPFQMEDFDAYADFMADAESSRHVGGPQSRVVAWRGFMTMAGAWQLQRTGMFSVIEKSTGDWVGRVGPWMPEGWPGTEVGWGIIRNRWNRGYATEAATAAIDWAFAELGWTEVIHVIAPDNAASQAVAGKLGAENLGSGRLPAPLDHLQVDIWSQSRDQWIAHHDSQRIE